ncbi:hypothetical protein M758_9G011400 [Ceratodon purpureus]|uniref:Uncharacterized protein n=1 Tax=Ceratodon purpureus TaxID=3225 RepID=A0A8T0GSX9_CERPU|nr:hypothetical protein KC19_9G011800 [Ceratodon purpureus]KAG0604831.1 hypothetical protein M758_9G011400 [Ceratodon purpureus]
MRYLETAFNLAEIRIQDMLISGCWYKVDGTLVTLEHVHIGEVKTVQLEPKQQAAVDVLNESSGLIARTFRFSKSLSGNEKPHSGEACRDLFMASMDTLDSGEVFFALKQPQFSNGIQYSN